MITIFTPDLFINKEVVLEILNKLTQPLLKPDDYPLTLDSCASFAAYISSVLYTEKLGFEYGNKLLLSLFSLSCSNCKDTDILSKDTLWEITTAWQDILIAVLPSMCRTDLKNLTKEFAEILGNQLLCIDVEHIDVEQIVGVMVNFSRCLHKTVPLLTSEMLMVLLNQELMETWKQNINNLCVWSEFMNGRFCSPYTEITYPEQISDIDIVKFFVMSHVTLKLIAEKVEENDDDEDELENEEDGDAFQSTLRIIRVFENPSEMLSDLLHTVCLASSCLNNYNVVSSFSR